MVWIYFCLLVGVAPLNSVQEILVIEMKKTTRLFSIFFIFIWLSFVSPRIVQAEYMLPYPSFMPGNKMYRISRIIDSLNTYWYFGNIAKIKYHLNLSDKYLVEAKTLMEYKQYLLATDALKRSDAQFMQVPVYFYIAREKNINTEQLEQLVRDSFNKHKEVETNLLSILPETFTWTPEKERQTELPLTRMIQDSIKAKEKIITAIIAD